MAVIIDVMLRLLLNLDLLHLSRCILNYTLKLFT